MSTPLVLRDYVVHGRRNGKPVAVPVKRTTIGRAPIEAGVDLPVFVHRAGSACCSQSVTR